MLLAGLASIGWDLWRSNAEGAFRLAALGEVWYRLSPGTIDLTRAVIERYIWPPLWDPGIVWLLLQPAVLVLAGTGLVLAWLGGRSRR